ncbi:hypothetical protein VIBRN418_00005 [Vibrio sp. N418]|nr:hypothetical protein VIBRN418_00005 [Vibrio sp. N418]
MSFKPFVPLLIPCVNRMVFRQWQPCAVIENRNKQNDNPYTNINWLRKQGS